MKENWLAKEQCTGCGACANICPYGAIMMKPDSTGFIYPVVNSTCIDCNLCEAVCEKRLIKKENRFTEPDTYAVWSKDNGIRYNSTSGGAFSEITKLIFKEKGAVIGACYNKECMVEHTMIERFDEIGRIRQSKYLQSDMGNIYRQIKEKLNAGRKVAFCGAPCQVAGLYAFLGKTDYKNLVTIDFICRGMNSPKAYRSWLDEIEQEEHAKVISVWFKYKEGGWKSSPTRTRLDFADGHYIVKEGKENLYMEGYLSNNLYIRPSCGNCEFKSVPRLSDITLADFWGIDKELDDDKGTSLVLVNSEKGRTIFESIKDNMVSHQREFKEIFRGNICFASSVNIPQESQAFLEDLDNGRFSEVFAKYTRGTVWKRAYKKIKKVVTHMFKIGKNETSAKKEK